MHFSPGDRVALTMMFGNNASEIAWTNLEATGQVQGTDWGTLARTGDSGQAMLPQFDHSGTRVIYSSSASGVFLTTSISDGDVYTVPYNNRQGGQATPLAGASDPTFNEYYPTFSPDDRLVVFDRVPHGQTSYNDPAAELFVVSANGGTATRLAANDPVQCAGKTSPGLTNSWPKWAPEVAQANGNTYYWLTFSSTRGQGGNPQLYISSVIVDANGQAHTSPALYLWNQPGTENNHTPAWDVFNIVQ
jgi:hypothetical protein